MPEKLYVPLILSEKVKIASFKKEVQEAFAKVSDGQAHIDRATRGGPQNGMWTDSKGQTLMLAYGRYGPRAGGPPLGLNIIINLPSPIQWPPTVQMAPQPMGYAPPPVGYAPPPAGYAPPPAGYAPPPGVDQNAEPEIKSDDEIAQI